MWKNQTKWFTSQHLVIFVLNLKLYITQSIRSVRHSDACLVGGRQDRNEIFGDDLDGPILCQGSFALH